MSGLKAHVVLKTESSKENPVTALPSSRTTTCACTQHERLLGCHLRMPMCKAKDDAAQQARLSRPTAQSPCTSAVAAAP